MYEWRQKLQDFINFVIFLSGSGYAIHMIWKVYNTPYIAYQDYINNLLSLNIDDTNVSNDEHRILNDF